MKNIQMYSMAKPISKPISKQISGLKSRSKSRSKSDLESRSRSGSGSDINESQAHPCVLVSIGVMCILIILAAILLVAVIMGDPEEDSVNNTWTRESRSRERKLPFPIPEKQPNGTHIKFRFFAAPNANEMSSYGLNEAEDFCKQRNGRLPVPRSPDEELQMINDIKILHQEAKCSRYAIGYKLDLNKRYTSLDQERHWPSLRVDTSAASELNDRDCVEVEVGPNAAFRIASRKHCNDVVHFDYIIFFKSSPEYCEKDPWGAECLYYSREQTSDEFEQVANSRLHDPSAKMVGVLLLDRELIPRQLLLPSFHHYKSTWIFEVKYILNYLDIYESILAPYKINVTIFQDPEKDCVAVNALKKFQIETVLCSENTGCPTCEAEPDSNIS